MAGSATLTAVESSPATNEPMIAATSASCLRWLAGAATAIGPIDPTLDGRAYGRSKHAAPARRRRGVFPDGEPVSSINRSRAERPGGAGSRPGPAASGTPGPRRPRAGTGGGRGPGSPPTGPAGRTQIGRAHV